MAINSKFTKECTDLIAEQLAAKKRFEKRLERFTEKKIATLLLFAQNYSLQVIADKEGVCLSSIRGRLRRLSIRHSIEFGKALAIRQVYKNGRDAIRNMVNFSDLDGLTPNDSDIEGGLLDIISNNTKRKF